MNTDKIFAEAIANEYAPKDTSKVIALRKLDQKAKGPANIFAYSFATPVTVFDRANLFTDNIFNIISEIDVVPRMPLRYWSLTRYGSDMIVPCKARRGLGEYTRLLGQMQEQFANIMKELGVEADYVPPEPVIDTSEELTIEKYDDIWVVEGGWLQRLMSSVNFSDNESVMYFDRVLRDNGVYKRMEEMGIRDGDTVSIYNLEFEYRD